MSNTTRPEAIQEAMDWADGFTRLGNPEAVALAAYVRELEAKLKERSEAADRCARRLSETVKICDKETDRAEKLQAELAEARKGGGGRSVKCRYCGVELPEDFRKYEHPKICKTGFRKRAIQKSLPPPRGKAA